MGYRSIQPWLQAEEKGVKKADCDNLRLDLRSLILGYTGGHNRSADATGTAKSLLRLDKDVGNILVFTQKWDVEKDFQGLGIGSQNDKFGLAAVQSLGSFVGTLLQLLVVNGLLSQVENLGRQGIFGQRICTRIGLAFHFSSYFYLSALCFTEDDTVCILI